LWISIFGFKGKVQRLARLRRGLSARLRRINLWRMKGSGIQAKGMGKKIKDSGI
jgi:hypothetical protein